MSYVRALLERRASPENPSTSLSSPAAWLYEALGAAPTASGVPVTEQRALRDTTVFGCIRILSETVGSLPLPVHERLEPRGRRKATEHRLYRVLNRQANPEMTAITFHEAMVGHLAGWGNSFAEIQRNNAGEVVALWPLLPDRTEAIRENGRKVIVTEVKGRKIRLSPDNVVHVPGFGFDGLMGYSPIRMARQAIGLALAAEEHGARLFSNGARPGGVLKTDKKLSKEAHERLKADWKAQHEGLTNAQRTAILEDGLSWQQIGINSDDAQWLDNRKFQVEEKARIYRMPLVLLGHTEKATSWGTGIEQFMRAFVDHTLKPYLVRYEQAYQSLFRERDQDRFYVEYLLVDLLAGDSEARAKFYQALFSMAALSPNDILDRENMNPVEGGDQRFVPLNMIPLELASQVAESGMDDEGDDDPDDPAEGDEADDDVPPPDLGDRAADRALSVRQQRSITSRERQRSAHRPLFRAAAARWLQREIDAVSAAAAEHFGQRSQASFEAYLREWYETQIAYIERQLGPVVDSFARLVYGEVSDEVGAPAEFGEGAGRFVSDFVHAAAVRNARTSRGQLLRDLREMEPDDDPVAVVEARLEQWADGRAESIAQSEVVRSEGAVAKLAYGFAGVLALRWVATGSSCPLCDAMDGRTVATSDPFLTDGEQVRPAEGTPLVVRGRIGHPPLHSGCDCFVVAG